MTAHLNIKLVRHIWVFVVDRHLNWKAHISSISQKIKRNIGAISRVGNYVNKQILINLYYALIYPFLTHALVAWGNTYPTVLDTLFILQIHDLTGEIF